MKEYKIGSRRNIITPAVLSNAAATRDGKSFVPQTNMTLPQYYHSINQDKEVQRVTDASTAREAKSDSTIPLDYKKQQLPF